MSQQFIFSFSGEDIENAPSDTDIHRLTSCPATEPKVVLKAPTTAFPVDGQAMLPTQAHDLDSLLSALPPKIAYGVLLVTLDDGTEIAIPRRELWDIRVQLMAESDPDGVEAGLGKDDIKTGVYEGGFKSWESSVDLVKVLAAERTKGSWTGKERRVLEMGCGTALPSLAVLQWQLYDGNFSSGLSLSLADYNPSVLQLVTVPNILLSWAMVRLGASWDSEGELDIGAEFLSAFKDDLATRGVKLSFFSGAWGPQFVQHVSYVPKVDGSSLLILAAETIYSPSALVSFTGSLIDILEVEGDCKGSALVAAKKVYFGVGGSVEDFCDAVRARDCLVEYVREESVGVCRAVVEIKKLR